MGGGGGIDPISVISSVVFGVVRAAASPQSRAEVDAARAASEDDSDQAEAAAEARRAAARQKSEAALLASARKAERAELADRDGLAQTLGAPSVTSANLKEKLGQ